MKLSEVAIETAPRTSNRSGYGRLNCYAICYSQPPDGAGSCIWSGRPTPKPSPSSHRRMVRQGVRPKFQYFTVRFCCEPTGRRIFKPEAGFSVRCPSGLGRGARGQVKCSWTQRQTFVVGSSWGRSENPPALAWGVSNYPIGRRLNADLKRLGF